MNVLQTLGVILTGLLAGEELIVRYGVQPALNTLEDRAHLLARIALVHRLKVVVPALMLPTVIVAVAVLIFSDGSALRWTGMIALVAFLLFSFLGTVPINMKVNDWQAENPPHDWQATVRRWEQIDVFRSSAAIIAFIAFALAA